MNKEDSVKHPLESKFIWSWEPDILITTNDSDCWKERAQENTGQRLKKRLFSVWFFFKIVVIYPFSHFFFFCSWNLHLWICPNLSFPTPLLSYSTWEKLMNKVLTKVSDLSPNLECSYGTLPHLYAGMSQTTFVYIVYLSFFNFKISS